MALQSFNGGDGADVEVNPEMFREIDEMFATHGRWADALASHDLELVGWDDDSPGGPFAIWRIKTTRELIAS